MRIYTLCVIIGILTAVTGMAFWVLTGVQAGKEQLLFGTFSGRFPDTPPKFLYSIEGQQGSLDRPQGIAINGEQIFVTDTGNALVRVFSKEGKEVAQWREADGRAFLHPYGIAVSGKRVFISDARQRAVYQFDTAGNFQKYIARAEMNGSEPVIPTGLAVDQNGRLYVSDVLFHRILIFTADGRLVGSIGSGGDTDGLLAYPAGVSVDDEGNIYVADANNSRIQVWNRAHEWLGAWLGAQERGNESFSLPRGIAIDPFNRVWVVDTFLHQIRVFDRQGTELFKFGKRGDLDGEFNFPNDIAIDRTGRVYVVDRENNRIQVFGY